MSSKEILAPRKRKRQKKNSKEKQIDIFAQLDRLPQSVQILFLFVLLIIVEGHPTFSSTQEIFTTSCILNSHPGDFTPTEFSVWPQVYYWCDLISQAAAKYQLDPNLIAAVIFIESGGRSDAISSAGAVGLMQVMSSDGLSGQIYGSTFASRPTVEDLKTPEKNIDTGSAILAANIQRTGSVRDGLKAYGPVNVGYTYADLVLDVYDQLSHTVNTSP